MTRLKQLLDRWSTDSDANERALVGRPWLSPEFAFRHYKVQDPAFREVRSQLPYDGEVRVQIPGRERSTMLYERDDIVAGVSFYFGPFAYETTSTMLFSTLAARSRHVLDVGAHTGIFSLIASAAGEDVFVDAFEVVPPIAERTRNNVELSGRQRRVRVHSVGLSDRSGTLAVHYNGDVPLATGASFEDFADRQDRPGATSLDVRVTTLDTWWREYRRPAVQLMKIDVERHEVPVFRGGRDMLTECRPWILAEVLSVPDFRSMFDELRGLGYGFAYVVDEDDGQLRRLDSELRYEDGHEYEYRGYHNVLFSVDELDDDVTSELAIVRQRALGGRAVPGSGASMAAEERAAARRSRANARIGALGRSARSFPIVKRTRHLTRGAARRLRDQLASRAVRPGSQ